MSRYLVLLTFLIGCGDPSPVEKCDDLVSLVCERVAECAPSEATYTECVEQLQTVLPCGQTKAVSPTYDRCMDQLESRSCSSLVPRDPDTGERTLAMPADCEDVILSRETLPEIGARGAISSVATELVD